MYQIDEDAARDRELSKYLEALVELHYECECCGVTEEGEEGEHRCRDCGMVMCNKCAESWTGMICEQCYSSMSDEDPTAFPPL